MNNRGQSIMSEYVMIFFVVIAAAVAMTVYVQRGLQARVHDARNFMISSVVNSGACDANCVQAAGGNISDEYEPYYSVMLSDVQHNEAETDTTGQGNAQVLGAVYTRLKNEATRTIATSCQLPPECVSLASSGPIPCYCTCPCSCPAGTCPGG